MPVYSPNIPQPGDIPSQSQDQILQNFQVLEDIANNTAEFITFLQQSSPPVVTANQNVLYDAALSTHNETYIQKQSFAGVKNIPFTASILSGATPASGTGGWTWLPSGMLLSFGTGTGTGLTTVTLSNPPPNQLLIVVVCPASSATIYSSEAVRFVNVVNASSFRVFCSVIGGAGLAGFNYYAIGY